jgi:hypothetical protein
MVAQSVQHVVKATILILPVKQLVTFVQLVANAAIQLFLQSNVKQENTVDQAKSPVQLALLAILQP